MSSFRGQRPLRGWFVNDSSDHRRRVVWLLFAAFAGSLILTGHLVDVQVVEHSRLTDLAAQEHALDFVIPAHRGEILDRYGKVLVSNKPIYSVYIDPGLIAQNDRSTDAAQIASVLALDPFKVQAILNRQTRYAFLADNVSDAVKSQLESLQIPGLIITPHEQRVYSASPLPNASFAANLLGYVNADGQGQYGVEGYYNKLLSGTPGQASAIRDIEGNAIALNQEQKVDPKDGDNIQLGLDSAVQYWAEQALAKGVDYAEAVSGELLIMDAHTGSIRAWAEYPSYDANHYSQTNIGLFRDIAIDGLYEPGSVMKVVTFAGGLENHAISPGTSFVEGQQVIDGYTIHDWDDRASHGTVTMQQVLDQSLNNGAIKVWQMEGDNALYKNLQSFGIGQATGVDLFGETNAALPPQSHWLNIDYAETAFGQHTVATPIEMLAAVNTIANGGIWVQPHAADVFIDPTTGQRTSFVPATRRVVSEQTASTLAGMMTGVVDNHDGSGFAARITGFKGEVAGKTGTASEPTNGKYTGDVVDSFVGFMPATNPQFTMLVVLNSPHTTKVAHEGAYLAAPVWHDLAVVIIDLWRIAPD